MTFFLSYSHGNSLKSRYRTGINGGPALIKDAVKDPFGDPYRGPGYQYSTASMYMDIDTKRLVPMCFLSPHYQVRVCVWASERTLLHDSCTSTPVLVCTQNATCTATPVCSWTRLVSVPQSLSTPCSCVLLDATCLSATVPLNTTPPHCCDSSITLYVTHSLCVSVHPIHATSQVCVLASF